MSTTVGLERVPKRHAKAASSSVVRNRFRAFRELCNSSREALVFIPGWSPRGPQTGLACAHGVVSLVGLEAVSAHALLPCPSTQGCGLPGRCVSSIFAGAFESRADCARCGPRKAPCERAAASIGTAICIIGGTCDHISGLEAQQTDLGVIVALPCVVFVCRMLG